jgi:hypothetical protein
MRAGGGDAHRRLRAAAAVWPIFFRRDKLLDFGLRGRGFAQHAWIYALCVVVMMPVLVLVSLQPDFADYYPMYKQAGRSWLDFLIWECVYLAQFFGLGAVLPRLLAARDAQLRVGRDLVDGRPYCMIHYGKPYLETSSAVIAGSRARLAGDAHAQHLRGLSRTRDGRGDDGHPGARSPPRAADAARAGELDAPRVPALARGHLDRLGARARGAGGEGAALVAGADRVRPRPARRRAS